VEQPHQNLMDVYIEFTPQFADALDDDENLSRDSVNLILGIGNFHTE
jgi:hypothetical protein